MRGAVSIALAYKKVNPINRIINYYYSTKFMYSMMMMMHFLSHLYSS